MMDREQLRQLGDELKERARPAANRVIRNLPGRRVRWGSLRRTTPFSNCYGWDRGLPIDRYYIEGWLERQARSVHGDVLEVRSADYALRYGGERVTKAHVVDIDATNAEATVIADLTQEGSLPDEAYDTIIMTQTLHVTADDEAGLRTLWRALRPGGTILFSGPCVGRIDHELAEYDSWRYTPNGLRRKLARLLPDAQVAVEGFGNVLAGAAYLYGIAVQELTPGELDVRDPGFPIVVCAKIDKPAD
jgi:SAM-dependent methyltransferase